MATVIEKRKGRQGFDVMGQAGGQLLGLFLADRIKRSREKEAAEARERELRMLLGLPPRTPGGGTSDPGPVTTPGPVPGGGGGPTAPGPSLPGTPSGPGTRRAPGADDFERLLLGSITVTGDTDEGRKLAEAITGAREKRNRKAALEDLSLGLDETDDRSRLIKEGAKAGVLGTPEFEEFMSIVDRDEAIAKEDRTERREIAKELRGEKRTIAKEDRAEVRKIAGERRSEQREVRKEERDRRRKASEAADKRLRSAMPNSVMRLIEKGDRDGAIREIMRNPSIEPNARTIALQNLDQLLPGESKKELREVTAFRQDDDGTISERKFSVPKQTTLEEFEDKTDMAGFTFTKPGKSTEVTEAERAVTRTMERLDLSEDTAAWWIERQDKIMDRLDSLYTIKDRNGNITFKDGELGAKEMIQSQTLLPALLKKWDEDKKSGMTKPMSEALLVQQAKAISDAQFNDGLPLRKAFQAKNGRPVNKTELKAMSRDEAINMLMGSGWGIRAARKYADRLQERNVIAPDTTAAEEPTTSGLGGFFQ